MRHLHRCDCNVRFWPIYMRLLAHTNNFSFILLGIFFFLCGPRDHFLSFSGCHDSCFLFILNK